MALSQPGGPPPIRRRPPPFGAVFLNDFKVAQLLLNEGAMMIAIEEEEDPRLRAILDGFDGLDDRELLGVLLGKGARGQAPRRLAAEVIDHVGGLGRLARWGPAALAELPGIGAARALRLAASVELGRRVAARAAEPREPLDSPAAVAELLTPRLGLLDHEQMWVLSLDGRNQLRGLRRVAQGGLHALVVSAGDILRAALWDGASGFILAHNHPSGSPEPSEQDIDMTSAVAHAAAAVGVALLDHVIVTASGAYASLAELGLISASRSPANGANAAIR